MPASLSQLLIKSIINYNSSQKARTTSNTTTPPAMMSQMKTLSNKDPSQEPMAKKATPPGSAPPAVMTLAGGDIRTYSQRPLSRNSSSWLMQSQQSYQDQTHGRKIQQIVQMSRPSSVRNSVESDAVGNSSAKSADDRKESEEGDETEEDRKGGHPQQGKEEQQPLPSTTSTTHPTRASSPLLTLYSPSSSILSSSPPSYINETTGESRITKKVLDIFLDQPALATPQDFIHSVARMEDDAWSGDGCSRSYVIADEEATGVSRRKKESSKGIFAKSKKDEDYELKEWKCSGAGDQCLVPVESGNRPFTQTASIVRNRWREGLTGQGMCRLLTPGGTH